MNKAHNKRTKEEILEKLKIPKKILDEHRLKGKPIPTVNIGFNYGVPNFIFKKMEENCRKLAFNSFAEGVFYSLYYFALFPEDYDRESIEVLKKQLKIVIVERNKPQHKHKGKSPYREVKER